MTFKEIYDMAMPQEKRKEERFNIWVTVAVRPLSVLLIKPLINCRVKPTTITKISVLASVIGFFLLAFGTSLAHTLHPLDQCLLSSVISTYQLLD